MGTFCRFRRFIRLALLLLTTAFVVGLPSDPANAHDLALSRSPDEVLQFDIPAQPLDDALKAYSVATGLEIFYNAALVERRSSPVVAGRLSRTVALGMLLDGTGHISQRTADGSFTIVPAPIEPRSTSDIMAQRRHFEGYLAGVQARISAALCGAPRDVAGDGDIFVRIWLAGDGAILRAEVLGRTAQYRGDIASLVLRGNAGAPPAGMPQPLTLAIFPPLPGSRECQASRDERVARKQALPESETAR